MILLQNVGKYYYSETSVTQALRKVNLSFHVGEFVAITGESGSGKSTLLNVISGMDTFDEGELFFNGEPTFQYDAADWEDFRREQIGFVFQDYNLIGHYSALDNVASALLIMGEDKENATRRAMAYLERVGLKGLENQRSSQLSSGQKQRLSIARALAKETKIIVADEPTGNLDSETGEQIIALLKELSNNRLILMVTHNYEQAEPYVTRKVRLHDGEVVADVNVDGPAGAGAEAARTDSGSAPEGEDGKPEAAASGGEKDTLLKEPGSTGPEGEDGKPEADVAHPKKEISKDSKEWKKHQRRIAGSFARMNTRTQKGRAMLFRIFFLFTAVISFVMIGQLYKCADDTYTKDYDNSIYYQKNDSRLSVRRKDGKELTDKDIEKMKSVKHVVQVDSQDYAGDVNYYIDEGKDYVYHYEVTREDDDVWMEWDEDAWMETSESTLEADKIPDFKKRNKFMRSTTCIDKSDLSEGRMPEKRNEIVMYPTKGTKLGDVKKIYFTAENIWESEYYQGHLKVVGFLKEETPQIYFYPDFCRMLTAAADGDTVTLDYYPSKEYGYQGHDQFILIIGEDLEEQAGKDKSDTPYARVSRNHVPNLEAWEQDGTVVNGPVERVLPGTNQIYVSVNKTKDNIPEELSRIDGEVMGIKVLGQGENDKETNRNFNSHSGSFMEVSEEVFNRLYPRQSSQASVYIKNYTKTDRVLRALDKLGYEGLSTYRISSVNYNEQKVMDRLIFISIALGILLLLIATEILILRSIMKIRIKDFFVMKSMGMQLPVIRQISIYEMTRYCVEAVVLAAVIMIILNIAGAPYITAMMIYYGLPASATYVFYNIILELVTVRAFNRLLTGRMTK